MSFSKDLSNKFFEFCNNNDTLDEISLFTKLMDSFIDLQGIYPEYAISLMHSYNGQIKYINSDTGASFKTANGNKIDVGKTSELTGISTSGNTLQCEVSDLAFVIYSEAGVKISYMQNKYDKEFELLTKKFKVDIDQFALLKSRPKFDVVDKKSNVAKLSTCDILYQASIESVGSYGVFYKTANSYELFYCPADLLKYIRPITTTTRGLSLTSVYNKKSKKVQYDHSTALSLVTHGNYRYNSIYEDCLCAQTIEQFAEELINFKIGTVIQDDQLDGIKEFLIEQKQYDLLDKIKNTVPLKGKTEISDETVKCYNRNVSFGGAKHYIFIKSLKKIEDKFQ